MFRPENWAYAFVNAAKTPVRAEEGLHCLKSFCHAALSLPGDLSGRNDADRLGRSIQAVKKRLPLPVEEDSFCLAERFIQLMLRKNCFHHYKKIVNCIEKIIEKQKGIEEVIVEAAVDLDKEFLREIEQKAKNLVGAREIKLTQRLIPELIGGIRLRWGSLLFDGSVRRSLEKMKLNLKSQTA